MEKLETDRLPCTMFGCSELTSDQFCPNCLQMILESADKTATEGNVNDIQIGGKHYKGKSYQHWDFAADNDMDYFAGQITKYITRWKNKNGLEDLEKARHFLDKYIELVKEGRIKCKR